MSAALRPTMRILVVDDHTATLRAMRLLLLSGGHQVVTAQTLADARCLFDEGGIDLILCDLWLPDGDGRDLIPVAARDGTRIVAVSGCDRGQLGSNGDGFGDYLTRPVSFDRVTDLLARASADIGSHDARPRGDC